MPTIKPIFLSVFSILLSALILYYFGTTIISDIPLNTESQNDLVVSENVSTEPSAQPIVWQVFRSNTHPFSFVYRSDWVMEPQTNVETDLGNAQIIEAVNFVPPGMSTPAIQFFLASTQEQQIYSLIANCETNPSACENINGVEYYRLSIPGLESSNTFITLVDDLMYSIIIDSANLSPSEQETIINSFSF